MKRRQTNKQELSLFPLGEEFPVQTSLRFNFLECYLWKAVIPTCSEAELMAFAGRSPCLVSVRRPVLQRFLLLCWVSKWHHQTSGFQMWCYLGKDTRAKSRGKQRRKTHFFRVLAVRTVERFQDGVRLSIWSLLVPHTQFGTKGQGYGSAREKIQGSAQNRTVISDTAALYNMV